MRHPLTVRQMELRSSFTRLMHGANSDCPPVFTLEPYALSREGSLSRTEYPEAFPPKLVHALEATTSAIVMFDSIIDSE